MAKPPTRSPTSSAPPNALALLRALEQKVLWLAAWTIHHANHVRPSQDGLKVGGHQASSASLATIMTALYFAVLKPQDRVAVKPHASPNFHAIQYLLGRQTREKLEGFRGYKGAQSYPSRTKDVDDVDFSTGSVGLGVAQTLFASLVQDYVRAHGWGLERPEGRMVALVGDAELDEGNIFEAMLEGWKQGLRNCWWVIDYNRQSLDAVVREGLWERYEKLFRAFGWDVVILKHGSLQQAAFAEPGGARLRDWIDSCPNQLYSALVFQGGAAWRKRLMDDLGDQGDVTRLIEARSDDELARLMTNLAGHDLPALPEQRVHTLNFGSEQRRINSTQRPPSDPAQVQRLGHVVMQTPHFLRSLNWYLDTLGLIVSDFQYVPGQRDRGPAMAFIRCDRGTVPSDHHTLALLLGPVAGYSHSAYQVTDLDAVAAGGEYLLQRGYQRAWGIGRHVLGSQIFDYWHDPDKLTVEHFTDGDLFDNTIEPGWAPLTGSGLSQWGPRVTQEFLGTKPSVQLVREVVAGLRGDNEINLSRLVAMLKGMSQ